MKKENSPKEKTIRSETTKVFFVIFLILIGIGSFTVYATNKGSQTFNRINGYVSDFKSAEQLKQQSLEIIGVFYLVASDHNLDILMAEVQRYDGLVSDFNKSLTDLKQSVLSENRWDKQAQLIELIDSTQKLFEDLNNDCQDMMLAMMEDRKQEGANYFTSVQKNIGQFKNNVGEIEKVFTEQMELESKKATSILKLTTWYGLALTLLGILATLFLINYLMKFLSITLLPISNLMNNMRQAVFSIDHTKKVIWPVSNYSERLFGENILNKDLSEILFLNSVVAKDVASKFNFAMRTLFGADEAQWTLSEGYLPTQISMTKYSQEKIVRLAYTPLFNNESKIQNIMVVAEDVTEVSHLKKESVKMEEELSAIKALIRIDRTQVWDLLNDFKEKISLIQHLTNSQSEPIEKKDALLRNLHTLKGNARMYYFNGLAEITHDLENKIIEIDFEESKKGVNNIDLLNLDGQLKALNKSFGNYVDIANKLYGHQNSLSTQESNNMALGSLYTGLSSMTLKLAKEFNKEIELKFIDTKIEISKDRISLLKDILIHLIQNSVDHGVEEKNDRQKLNKPQIAEITISFAEKESEIEVVVGDDGRGIDVNRISTKAVELNMITPEKLSTLNEVEKLNLIFIPGLSSKVTTSIVSGRGVGMDAVKHMIEEIGGKIFIWSKPGIGTKFTITLPK